MTASRPSFLPQPRRVELRDGTFSFSSESELRETVDAGLAAEAYTLTIADDGVAIRGGSPAAVFSARQTLLQLFPPERVSPDRTRLFDPAYGREAVELPHLHIEDEPQYAWRGYMLDVARHFMPLPFVLKLIDQLAAHKLNVLHLHLTDDQGWRIPIPGYPKLTEIGAHRPQTIRGYDHEGDEIEYDGLPHGGAYTREELERIVAYAARRHIRVVPEVDLPGHIQAALAAYPELGSGVPTDVRLRWGISTRILKLDDATTRFVDAVFKELTEIFPGTYIHAGGDEVPKKEWRESPLAQAKMKELGLDTEEQLQGWFTSEVHRVLAEHGRRLVAWDEVVQGGAPTDTLIMAWRGVEHGVRAAQAGYDVIMSPRDHLYLDLGQSDDPGEPVTFPDPRLPLEKVFAFEPTPAELVGTDAAARIVGTQTNLWTEYVPTQHDAEYMTFPRLCAFAEVAWRPALPSTEQRDFADFRSRLVEQLKRLDAAGVNYRPLDA